jgi:hypothetical protein
VGWSTASPFYTTSGFDAVSGNFTVPSSGKYSVKITVNYSTSVLTASLGSSVNPSFVFRTTTPTTLLAATLPVLNVSIALVLTLRALLSNGCVTIAGDVFLNAGEVVNVAYIADGFLSPLNLGASISPGCVWSMSSLF